MTGPVVRRKELNLTVHLDRDAETPLYRQLELQIIAEICRGRLRPATALPGTRELATQLDINRKTVVVAYDELVAQGWLVSSPTRGTFVSEREPDLPDRKMAGTRSRPAPEAPHYDVFNRTGELTPVVMSGGPRGSFDDGLPDPRILPLGKLARAYRSALLKEAHLLRLGYGDPRGNVELRKAIARMLNSERGLSVGIENICITRGSQMAIYLATRVLAEPGDTVALEELSYPPVLQAFASHGANVVPIRLDEFGLDLDHLEEQCRKTRIRSLYLTPHHHFPTAVTLPPSRRMRLLSIAEQYRFSIIEDDYDHEFNFDPKPLLPMAGFAPSRVVYIGSFSKVLSPHLRMGYLVACVRTIDAFASQILLMDRQGDQVNELAVAHLLESGDVSRHARRALEVYRTRRDGFGELLHHYLGDRATFRVPSGGLAYWVEFENRDFACIEAAVANGLRILTSRQLQTTEQPRLGIRLGYASKNSDEIADAVARLRKLLP